MAFDKVPVTPGAGADIFVDKLDSGDDLPTSALVITDGHIAARVGPSNPLPTYFPSTQTVDVGSAPTTAVTAVGGGALATDAHLLDAVAALGDVLAALGATLDVSGSVTVSGPIDVASLPSLPAGSAVIGHVVVDSAGNVSVTSLPSLPAGSNAIGSVSVSNFPATQPISAVSLPLPSGAATDAKQDTGNTSLATLAGIVSAGAALANISDRVGRLLGVITGKDGATAASTSNGVPVAPETSSVWDVKDRVGRLLGVVTGADGATAASVGNGVPVQPGTSTLWDVKDRVGRLIGLATGADGATGASLSNAHPVQPGTSTTWDVSSRAARLLGALTGINGSSIATGANPVPVQMSDGSAVFTAAKSSQFPTSLGPAAGSASLSTVPPTSTTYFTGTITSATVIQVVNGPCTVYHVEATNSSGGNLFVGLYDTSTTPSNGTDFPKIEVAAPNGSPATRDLATRGVKFSNKLYAVVASASRSATPAAQTAVGITIVYDT